MAIISAWCETVAIVPHRIDRFANNLAIAANHRRIGIFAMIHRTYCECDAALHHGVIDGIESTFDRRVAHRLISRRGYVC
jgi:hypothetical protein